MTFPARLAPALLLAAVAAPAFAQDVAYELVNSTGLTVMEFYTSPADTAAWGEDILGANVIAAGEAGTVTLPGAGAACAYDLLFVMEDGQELQDQVDVCSVASYTLTQ